MEKVYNGAVLALPEREEELFARINERTAARREQRAQAEAEAREMALYAGALPERELPRVDGRRLLGLGLRLLLGCCCIGAGARGWCGMELAISGAAVCLIWAVAAWRRK